MKRDKLEQFIAENRDQFDMYDPGEKAWTGISNRMQRRSRLPDWKTILWRAAIVFIIFAISFLIQEYIHRNNLLSFRKERKTQFIEIPELREAEIYYTNLVDEKIREIEPLVKDHPGISDELKTDLEKLDSIYADLRKDLSDNIANDEVVEAMIQNYRLKLQILEDLQDYLMETSKNKENEKSELDI